MKTKAVPDGNTWLIPGQRMRSGRNPSGAMPKPKEFGYACAPCSKAAGRQQWVSFPSVAERDAAMDLHWFSQHAVESYLRANPARWLGCGELVCVCTKYGPPCGHERHAGCYRCDPVKRRELNDRRAAAEAMAMQMSHE